MKRITSLNDLLIEELAELLNAEDRLAGALPKMKQSSQSQALKAIFDNHLESTKKQAARLRDIFNNIGQNPHGRDCKAIKGYIQEVEQAVNNSQKGSGLDNT